MRLSSMADYAVVAMVAAVRQCGPAALPLSESAGDEPCAAGKLIIQANAGHLARETGLPLPTVQKLVSRLVGAGLLRSSRGVGGGLCLARPAAAISLADIVEAVEGPIALTACVSHGRSDCTIEQNCSVRAHWPIVNEAMRGALAGVSLARLAQNAPAADEMMEAVQ